MPRPRTIGDEAVLRAAAGLMGRVGPGKLTLARVAEEVGLSPATLVQRFGSWLHGQLAVLLDPYRA
jgi:AcrR family transcriptional regulator